jgi:hypothetical protein
MNQRSNRSEQLASAPCQITSEGLRAALVQRARERDAAEAARIAALPPVPPAALTPAQLLEALKRRA